MAAFIALWLSVALALDHDPEFLEAQHLYRELRFEEAALRFQSLASESERSDEELSTVLVWAALCHAQLGQQEETRAALQQALRRHRDLVAPPETPPAVLQMIVDIKAEIASRGTSSNEPPSAPPAQAQGSSPAFDDETAVVADTPDREQDGSVWLPVIAYSVSGVGAAAMVSAAVLTSLAINNAVASGDPGTTQRDAVRLAGDANVQLVVAGVLAGTGALLVGGGIGTGLLGGE